jgi:TM2 domain-containing membrane protein YozV
MNNYITQVDKIVRDRWGRVGKGWKTFIVVLLVLGATFLLISAVIWFTGKVLGALSVRANKNSDLYFPRVRR